MRRLLLCLVLACSTFVAIGSAATPASADPANSGEFVALSPVRILDTRDGTGRGGVIGPLGHDATFDVQFTGQGGIPASGVQAVVFNATVTNPTGNSFLTVWPTGGLRPFVSNLNYTPGLTIPNFSTVAIGDGGKLSVYNNDNTAHVIFDVLGYYTDDAGVPGGRFHSTPEPFRLFDTRSGHGGVPATRVQAGAPLQFDVRNKGGVPGNPTAVVMNVTATESTGPSHVTVWPSDASPKPLASNLNFGAGATTPNLVTMRVPADGIIRFEPGAGGVHLIADVVGWYDEDRSTAAGRYMGVHPFRWFDTRNGSPFPYPYKIEPEWALVFDTGPPEDGYGAFLLNVTVTEPTAPGYLTVFPDDMLEVPLASNLNFVPGQTVPNFVIVRNGIFGGVDFFNSAGYTHVIVDTFGFFTSDQWVDDASSAGAAAWGGGRTLRARSR